MNGNSKLTAESGGVRALLYLSSGTPNCEISPVIGIIIMKVKVKEDPKCKKGLHILQIAVQWKAVMRVKLRLGGVYGIRLLLLTARLLYCASLFCAFSIQGWFHR